MIAQKDYRDKLDLESVRFVKSLEPFICWLHAKYIDERIQKQGEASKWTVPTEKDFQKIKEEYKKDLDLTKQYYGPPEPTSLAARIKNRKINKVQKELDKLSFEKWILKGSGGHIRNLIILEAEFAKDFMNYTPPKKMSGNQKAELVQLAKEFGIDVNK